ncbi:hypothetical protein Aple_031270 [Acrocarpospora pleiomorpha]|uniref:Uncharacterized protein n=1 Tax=Acrocarpospora pleiomorpha TaxID=90975 RepID=A0A5M3XKP8_9ACTN|nr:hypothetical protein [Acrocarpospora pleiomorpha]GES20231.1 hypothetical protein Aple_031270 [Acrocarpospora pleiomorpha]
MCASLPIALEEYVASIGNWERVVNMLVRDTQRIVEYAKLGYAIEQPSPGDVRMAFERLVEAEYNERLI